MSGYAQGYLNWQQLQRQQAQDDQTKLMNQIAIRSQMQQQADQQRMRDSRTAGGAALYGLQAPPQGNGSQPPMPGQASVPMNPPNFQQPPLQPPVSPSGGMGGMQIQAPPQQQPQQVQPYKPMPTSPQGATPQLSMPQGNMIPPPPQGGQQPMQGQPQPQDDSSRKSINIKDIIATLKRNNVPDDMVLDTLDSMKPVMNEMNAQEVNDIKAQLAATKAANSVYEATFKAHQLEQGDRRLDQGDTRIDQGQQKIDAAKQKAEKEVAEGNISPETIDYYARQSIAGDSSWQVGLARGKVGQRLIAAVKDRIPQLAQESGISAEDSVGIKSETHSNQAALTAVTKDITAIKPYKDMLDTNADIAKNLATKIAKTNLPYANKTINWLQTNAISDPDVSEYLAQMRIVQTEAARVLNNPRLVGQLTDSARGEMDDILNGNMSLESTIRVIDRLQADGKNRVNALVKQKDSLVKDLSSPRGKGKDNSSPASSQSFDTEAQAEAAAKSGKIKVGDRITVGGVTGTWQ